MRLLSLNASTPTIKQGEFNSSAAQILVPLDMRSYNLFLVFELPSGEKVFTPSILLDANNMITYVLPAAVLSEIGRVQVELQGFVETSYIKSVTYSFTVVKSLTGPTNGTGTELAKEDYLPWFTEAAQIKEEVELIADEYRLDEMKRGQAETLRISQEIARVAAEGLRVIVENNRIESEEIREDNEAIRIANENQRIANLALFDEWVDPLTGIEARVDAIITTPVEGVSAQEIIDARDGKATLGANLLSVKSQLADKVRKGESGAITNAMLSQEVKTSMTGGSVAVVGVGAVLEENITDGAVSSRKTDFIEILANLFNYKQIIVGYQPLKVFLVSHYNDLEISATSVTSQVFKVGAVLKFVSNIPMSSVTYYNADGLRTGGLVPTVVSNYFAFMLPAGIKFFRMQYHTDVSANTPTFMILEGEVFPPAYIPFGGVLKDTVKIDSSQILNPPVTKPEFSALNTKVTGLEQTVLSSVVNTTFKKSTVVLMMDSISALNTMDTAITKRTYAEGYFTWANILLGQRFKLINNAGIGGNTTTQMLARLQADVLDYNPSYCFALGGINDIIQSVSADTIIANLTNMYTQMLAKGIIVLASKILPSSMTTAGAFTTNVNKVNKFIEEFGFTHDNYILLNMGKNFSDPETGNPPTAMSTDGTHPVKLGGFYLGKAIAEELQYIIPPRNDFGSSNAKRDMMNPNPMMTGNVSGLATSYSLVSAANTIPTKIARTDITGEYQRLTVSEIATTSYFGLTSSMGYGVIAVGEKYYAQCEISLNNVEKFDKAKLYLHVLNESNQIVASAEALYSQDTLQVAMPDWKGVLKTHEITVPTGGVKLLSKIEYNIKGVIDVGRYEVKKA